MPFWHGRGNVPPPRTSGPFSRFTVTAPTAGSCAFAETPSPPRSYQEKLAAFCQPSVPTAGFQSGKFEVAIDPHFNEGPSFEPFEPDDTELADYSWLLSNCDPACSPREQRAGSPAQPPRAPSPLAAPSQSMLDLGLLYASLIAYGRISGSPEEAVVTEASLALLARFSQHPVPAGVADIIDVALQSRFSDWIVAAVENLWGVVPQPWADRESAQLDGFTAVGHQCISVALGVLLTLSVTSDVSEALRNVGSVSTCLDCSGHAAGLPDYLREEELLSWFTKNPAASVGILGSSQSRPPLPWQERILVVVHNHTAAQHAHLVRVRPEHLYGGSVLQGKMVHHRYSWLPREVFLREKDRSRLFTAVLFPMVEFRRWSALRWPDDVVRLRAHVPGFGYWDPKLPGPK